MQRRYSRRERHSMAGPYFRKTSWPPFEYEGVSYDLSHLDEYEFKILDSDNVERRVAVTFDDHCFTRKPENGDDQALAYPDSDRDPGHFCFQRHELSLRLRDHIAYAANGHVWNVQGENFAAVPVIDHSGNRALYGIVFSLDPVTGLPPVDLHMRVQTAHVRDEKELVTFGSVRFPHLVKLRMQHRRPHRIMDHGRKRPKIPML